MYDIVSDGIRSIVRSIARLWLLDVVLFQLGRGALLIFTMGRYPARATLERHRGRIQCVGLLVLLLFWLGVALFNHLHR